MKSPPWANWIEMGLDSCRRFFTISEGNKAPASTPDRKPSSTSSELEWGDFWKQWVKVWSFLSFVLFTRIPNFPKDLGTWIIQWLILPIGPAWAAFSLWRYRAMRLRMVLLSMAMTIAWCLAVLGALVFWLEPEAWPLQFRALAGALSVADREWTIKNPRAWDVIHACPEDRRSETFLQIIVANRSADPRAGINIYLTWTGVCLAKAFVRLKPYSSVAPWIQHWIWSRLGKQEDAGGIPSGFCPKTIPQGATWTWCKSIAATEEHTDNITIRQLQPRQVAILYLESFMSQKRGMIDVRAGDLGQASVELTREGGGP